jgi:hypothetical protein
MTGPEINARFDKLDQHVAELDRALARAQDLLDTINAKYGTDEPTGRP